MVFNKDVENWFKFQSMMKSRKICFNDSINYKSYDVSTKIIVINIIPCGHFSFMRVSVIAENFSRYHFWRVLVYKLFLSLTIDNAVCVTGVLGIHKYKFHLQNRARIAFICGHYIFWISFSLPSALWTDRRWR